jgi:hypothetical protein
MSQITPFTGSVLQSGAMQRLQSTDRADAIRKAQDTGKNVAAQDRFEHAVESAEALTPIHDNARQRDSRRRQQQHHSQEPEQPTDELPPSLDLTA